MPFQRWAARAEAIHRSPLGLLIHARHGLWHGYRGALAVSRELKNLPHPHSESRALHELLPGKSRDLIP